MDIKTQDNAKEMTRPPRMKEFLEKNGMIFTNVTHGLRQLHKDATKNGEMFMFVHQYQTSWPEGLTEWLRETNANVVVVHRNPLDHVLCTARDCMTMDIDGINDVFENGTAAHLCFARRGSSFTSNNVFAKRMIDEKNTVYINFSNPDALRNYLDDPLVDKFSLELNLARHYAWFNASLAAEDLSAFEYDVDPLQRYDDDDDDDDDDHPPAGAPPGAEKSNRIPLITRHSILAWKLLLAGAGFPLIDYAAILSAMQHWIHFNGARQYEPYGHRILNCDAVADVIRAYGYLPHKPSDPCL